MSGEDVGKRSKRHQKLPKAHQDTPMRWLVVHFGLNLSSTLKLISKKSQVALAPNYSTYVIGHGVHQASQPSAVHSTMDGVGPCITNFHS